MVLGNVDISDPKFDASGAEVVLEVERICSDVENLCCQAWLLAGKLARLRKDIETNRTKKYLQTCGNHRLILKFRMKELFAASKHEEQR